MINMFRLITQQPQQFSLRCFVSEKENTVLHSLSLSLSVSRTNQRIHSASNSESISQRWCHFIDSRECSSATSPSIHSNLDESIVSSAWRCTCIAETFEFLFDDLCGRFNGVPTELESNDQMCEHCHPFPHHAQKIQSNDGDLRRETSSTNGQFIAEMTFSSPEKTAFSSL